MKGVYFVSGIDTDIGKTVATGMLAKQLLQQGKSVITQKPVQTGCQDIAEDIAVHRKIMGIPMQEADEQRLTMPESSAIPPRPTLPPDWTAGVWTWTKSAPPHKNWRRSTKSFWSKARAG